MNAERTNKLNALNEQVRGQARGQSEALNACHNLNLWMKQQQSKQLHQFHSFTSFNPFIVELDINSSVFFFFLLAPSLLSCSFLMSEWQLVHRSKQEKRFDPFKLEEKNEKNEKRKQTHFQSYHSHSHSTNLNSQQANKRSKQANSIQQFHNSQTEEVSPSRSLSKIEPFSDSSIWPQLSPSISITKSSSATESSSNRTGIISIHKPSYNNFLSNHSQPNSNVPSSSQPSSASHDQQQPHTNSLQISQSQIKKKKSKHSHMFNDRPLLLSDKLDLLLASAQQSKSSSTQGSSGAAGTGEQQKKENNKTFHHSNSNIVSATEIKRTEIEKEQQQQQQQQNQNIQQKLLSNPNPLDSRTAFVKLGKEKNSTRKVRFTPMKRVILKQRLVDFIQNDILGPIIQAITGINKSTRLLSFFLSFLFFLFLFSCPGSTIASSPDQNSKLLRKIHQQIKKYSKSVTNALLNSTNQHPQQSVHKHEDKNEEDLDIKQLNQINSHNPNQQSKLSSESNSSTLTDQSSENVDSIQQISSENSFPSDLNTDSPFAHPLTIDQRQEHHDVQEIDLVFHQIQMEHENHDIQLQNQHQSDPTAQPASNLSPAVQSSVLASITDVPLTSDINSFSHSDSPPHSSLHFDSDFQLRSYLLPRLNLSSSERSLYWCTFARRHHGVQPTLTHSLRRHCSQLFRPSINNKVQSLLQQLTKFQERAKEKDSLKAKSKRRFVAGLKEVLKGIKTNR